MKENDRGIDKPKVPTTVMDYTVLLEDLTGNVDHSQKTLFNHLSELTYKITSKLSSFCYVTLLIHDLFVLLGQCHPGLLTPEVGHK